MKEEQLFAPTSSTKKQGNCLKKTDLPRQNLGPSIIQSFLTLGGPYMRKFTMHRGARGREIVSSDATLKSAAILKFHEG